MRMLTAALIGGAAGATVARLTPSKVPEPFEIVDRTGKVILRVSKSSEHQGGVIEVMNASGKPVAWVSGAAGGGFIKTQSSGGFPEAAIGTVGNYAGVVFRDAANQFRASMFLENGKPGLSLRNENYVPIAVITQGASGGGHLELGDAAGNAQVRTGITPGGCGRVETFPERPPNTRAVGAPGSFIVGNC